MKLNRTLSLLLVATATVAAGAAVAAAATTSTATTTAQGTAAGTPAPGGKHWRHHGEHGGMLVGVLLRATRQLNLTAEQESTIKGMLSNARTQRKAGAASLDVFTLANPGDPNYATALQNAKAAAATRLQNEVDLQNQIYNVLTADQKAKLPQVLADMKSKAEQRRAAWLQEHETGSAEAAGSN